MPESRSPRPIATAVAGILVLLAVLTGCVGIPNTGPVGQGLSLSTDSGSGNIAFNPEGPERDASQLNILKGFVASFTSATGGYAVARSFLSSSFQSKWVPSQIVQVRNGPARLTSVDATTVQYSFGSIASVDSGGSYSEGASQSTLQFGFVREDKQWRISSAPNGIVLADQTFQRIFRQYTLYFLDQSNKHLVPDVRWFPSGTAPTRIPTALLGGPPAWLKGAAFSRFPDGTQLSDSGTVITPEAGVARVDLTKEAASASPFERQLMQLQLTESLSSVASISRVAISVEGVPMAIDDLGANAPVANLKVDGQALVLRNGDFGYYANGRVASISQLSPKVVALSPRAATLASDQNSVVVLGTGGVSVVRRGTGATTVVDARLGLIAPSLDEDGYVWSVPLADPNAIEAIDGTGLVHQIAAGLPIDSQIVSLEVSREGARVVMLLATSTGPRLVVAAILRNSKQVPTGIGPFVLDVSATEGEAIDATWVDQSTVATLVSVDGQSKVALYVIGGKRTDLNPLDPATSIVGGNSIDDLRVLGGAGTIWTYPGSSWQDSKVAVSFIGTQR